MIISHSLIGTEPNWFSNIFFIHCFPVSIELCWGWFSLNMILWLTQPLTGDISHWSKHTAHPQNIVKIFLPSAHKVWNEKYYYLQRPPQWTRLCEVKGLLCVRNRILVNVVTVVLLYYIYCDFHNDWFLVALDLSEYAIKLLFGVFCVVSIRWYCNKLPTIIFIILSPLQHYTCQHQEEMVKNVKRYQRYVQRFANMDKILFEVMKDQKEKIWIFYISIL